MKNTGRLPVSICIVLGIVALVGIGSTARAVPIDKVPTFAIPRMSHPPTLDGVIDPQEWRESCAISGATDQGNDILIPRPTTFFLAWDSDHLYFACRAYLQPGYKPSIVDGRSPGVAYCYDDGLELVFQPKGQNVSTGNHNVAFKLFLNCLGFDGDLTKLAVGQQLKTWNEKFKTATRITAPGTAPGGGSWWEMEVSTSLADFELGGPNKAGDPWLLMLGINHIPPFLQARIPAMGGYFTSDGKDVGTLVEDTPAAKFTMDSLSNLATDGTASMRINAINPRKDAATLTIDVNVAGKIVKHETLSVAPGAEANWDLNEKLPADVKSGDVSVKVSWQDKPLLTYYALFKVGEYSFMTKPVEKQDPNKFSFTTNYNPVRGELLVKGDTYFLPDPTSAKSLEYRVIREGSDKPVVTGTIVRVAEYFFQDVVKLPLEPGKYTVEATLNLNDGKKLGPMTAAIEKKDEAKAFPAWWGKKFGNPDRVIPPFTAITHNQYTFGCWGREYTLNALGLIDGVKSQGENVLAAPARIVVVANGKEEVIPLGAPKVTETTDWRIRFEGTASGAGLDFTAKGWLEQDGLVYCDLTYRPHGDQPVKVDALRIEYPLSENDADALVCIGPGANFASKSAILLPKDKQGRLWSTLDTGRTGSNMKIGSFYPSVWVGSERRGFLWCADNDRGWIPDDAMPAHEVVRAGNAVVLRNNIVGHPATLDAANTISFSYMASPFKPLPKGWRMIAATDDGTFFQPFRGVRKDSKTGQMICNPANGNMNFINPESRYPEEWSALWAEQKPQADAHYESQRYTAPYEARTGINFAHMSFQLLGYGHKSLEEDVFNYFGPEWDAQILGDTWNETYTDYAMYLFDRAYREGGVRSTYWDLTFPIMSNSLLSGLAYRLPDGRVEPGYNNWNIRNFYMRLWSLAGDHGLNPGGIGCHSTNAYVFASVPWVDAILDGERGWNLDVSDDDWVDYYPIERMRSMSSPHNWGVGICWMSNFETADPKKLLRGKTVHAEYVWLHDSWKNPYLTGPTQMPDSVLDWGVNDDEHTTYVPYWRNPYIASSDKDVLVSVWKMNDRIMIEAFNYDRKNPKDVTLKISLDELGLMPKLQWQEFVGVRDLYKQETDAPATIDVANKTLTIKGLAPHRGRLVGVRRY